MAKQRAHQPILRAGCELHDDIDDAFNADDEPEQLVRRVQSEIMHALTFTEHQRIEQLDLACRRRKGRLKDEGAR